MLENIANDQNDNKNFQHIIYYDAQNLTHIVSEF